MAAISEKVASRVTEDDVAFYRENGYLVIPDALTPEEVEILRDETTALCRGERGDIGNLPAVSPDDTDADVIKRILCIHHVHRISPIMYDALSHPVMVDGLTSVIGPNVKCMQSMLFIKSAGKPGQAWHQDEIYIPTRDQSLTGGWFALDDATTENGCLWVIPGSHKRGILWPQHVQHDKRFDCAHETFRFPYTDDDAIPVEVKTGALVFFHGYLLHRSFPNRAKSGFRRVLVNHYMSAESLLPWRNLKPGERMATADMREIIMIAGEDPYAYKGTKITGQPNVRTAGDGGCGDGRQDLRS
ncbi:MAG: phytanoyl-CoA dioxygenase family protein [Gemmatimonadetes bacterium]|nr:phytanoyl-CoA dioxygenase family protein [Gemmatimonadota bacterium]MYF74892.1 phytanoyl-CoA dioxygenase family protein [Gemmatimonadota bacterium]MYK53441.1 phytanoyl-CoA dioxygenase family protein [Gemmatimonadota bacterium]